jgi:hypothetical protein
MALTRRRGVWAYGDQARTPVDAARELAWHGPKEPGAWTPVVRTFRDGHTATWWATDATLGFWGPNGLTRRVVATADPSTLPKKATWYLATDLPRPGSPRAAQSPYPPADLAEVVRIYGIQNWIEQGCKQVKDELGWADFQVRSHVAIRRHQSLVHCAFAFCWEAGRTSAGSESASTLVPEADAGEGGPALPAPPPPPCRPKAIRAVPGRLTLSIVLQRWWRAWSNAPPPPELQALIDAVTTGQTLNLSPPN